MNSTPDPSALSRTLVVLLHGLCSTPDELMTLNNALKRAAVPTLSMVIPGYSFDPQLQRQVATRFETWLEHMHQRLQALDGQYERIVLAGISAGANLALAYTLRFGERVQGLVLLSTPLRLDGWNVPFYQFLLPLALYTPLGHFWRYREKPPYGIKNERIRAWVVNALETRRISQAGAEVLETPHLREHHRLQRYVRSALRRSDRERLPALPPALALHAREDDVASLNNLWELEHRWHGGALTSVILEDSYHMISVDNERYRVCQEVLAFLNALATPVVESDAALEDQADVGAAEGE